jgi:iron complex transport system substrate-binding protein
MQSKYAAELISFGIQVLIFNQRSIAEILRVIVAMGRLVAAEPKALELVASYEARLAAARARALLRTHRPRVYFEEWFEPMISGISWVSELIELAGGQDIFRERARQPMAKGRIVSPEEVIAEAPEIVLASWCGKPFRRDAFVSRPGFAELPAVRSGRVHEVDPSIILQPGPACLTDGLDTLERLLSD